MALFMVMVSWVCTYLPSHQDVYAWNVQLFVHVTSASTVIVCALGTVSSREEVVASRRFPELLLLQDRGE